MEENPQVFFCCCEGNYCNERFTHLPDLIGSGNRGEWQMHRIDSRDLFFPTLILINDAIFKKGLLDLTDFDYWECICVILLVLAF